MKAYIRVSLAVILAVLSGCAAADRAKGIKSTFLEGLDVTKQLNGMPFDHSWVYKPNDSEEALYTAVYVKPVRTDLLDKDAWRASISVALASQEGFNEKVNEVAGFFREQVIEKIKNYPDPKFTVADGPGPKVLTVEIALTEVEFSHPGVHAGAIAAPIPGAAQALATISDPHAAFALRVTDSQTGELIATAADRKFPPIRVVDLNKVTISSSVREICMNWAKELVDALNQGRLGKVERRGVMKLLPW